MELKRTQVYLRPEQHADLKEEARRQGISVTELLRRIVDEYLRHNRSKDDFMKIVALGRSGKRDISINHDRYLAEAIANEDLN